ncbi:hypothetical protein [Nostoc piscinale]|uniref:hypothetical protein n=1 Tax=Nostoc piscinale TaxID=224012 RepID=UPI0011874F1C|nr:hypothetical protein [Nostoc piscinale]
MKISNDEQAIAISGLFFILSCHTQMHYLKCQVIQWLIFDDGDREQEVRNQYLCDFSTDCHISKTFQR